MTYEVGANDGVAPEKCLRKGVRMRGIAFTSRIWRQIFDVGLGFVLSAILAQLGYAQSPASYSAIFGQSNLTGLPGLNGAQQTMAQSINNVCPTINNIAVTPNQADLARLCSAMVGNSLQVQGQPNPLGLPSLGLNASGLQGALQQLNGGAELVVPTSQTSVTQTTQTTRQTGAIEARLSQLRNLTTGTVLAGAGSPQAGQIAALSTLEPDGRIIVEPGAPLQFAYSTGPLGVYVNGLGQFGSRDMTSTVNAFSFNNAGFIAGADYLFTPQLIAGLAFGYTRSNTNFDSSAVSPPGQFLRGNLLQGNLYATYYNDAFYLNGIGLIGGSNNDSRRQIVLPNTVPDLPGDRIATGSFGSQVQGLSLSGGYSLPFGALILTPTARLLYQHLGVDAFSENGALGADLQYGSTSLNTFLSFLGAEAQYAISTPLGVLNPLARFHWAHLYTPNNTAVSVAYSNDPSLLSSFILPGAQASRNYFDLGVGVSLQLSGNSSGFVNYDSILGLNHTTYNSFTAGIRLTF
jgi:outer membrane autotransporter protein